MESSSLKDISFIWDSLDQIQQPTAETKNIQIKTIYQELINDESINYGLGCMFGAFMGDALGSYCQFQYKIQPEVLQQVMKMPGKGTFNIKPAQFTDDSELASHLLQGLYNFNQNQQFVKKQQNLQQLNKHQNETLFNIANEYVIWRKSNPFDIGNTTQKALKILQTSIYQIKIKSKQAKQQGTEINLQKQMFKTFKEIQHVNKFSESNGSLMRITPMAYFISLLIQSPRYNGLKCQDFKKFIKCQINMTHGSQLMQQVGYAWVQLLVQLITRKQHKKQLKEIFSNFISKYQNDNLIKDWIKYGLEKQYLPANEDQGWACLAFSFGIKKYQQLLQKNQDQFSQNDYRKIIKDIISRAGDTDTNAAIVGGLIGAILGFKKLPLQYLKKQFQLQLDQEDYQCSRRGPFYQPRRQFIKALELAQRIKNIKK